MQRNQVLQGNAAKPSFCKAHHGTRQAWRPGGVLRRRCGEDELLSFLDRRRGGRAWCLHVGVRTGVAHCGESKVGG